VPHGSRTSKPPSSGSVIASDQDGRVTHWNSGAARLFGWSAAGAVGLPVKK
jgi:PAS domain S-box-containing protein